MSLTEVEQNREFFRRFVDELRSNRSAMPALWVKKLVRCWFNLGYRGEPSRSSIFIAGVNLVLLVLGSLGAWHLLRGPAEPMVRWWALFAVLFIFAMTGVHVLLLALLRYACPALVFVILFASVAVDRLLGGPRAAP
jgi:hypothetical protein